MEISTITDRFVLELQNRSFEGKETVATNRNRLMRPTDGFQLYETFNTMVLF